MYLVHEGEVSILIPKSLDEAEKERKAFLQIRDEQIFGSKYEDPTMGEVYARAKVLMPTWTYKRFKKLPFKDIDYNLKILVNWYSNFPMNVGEYRQVGLGNLSMYYKNCNFLYKEVASFGPGKFFGELACMTGETRAATIVAKSPCHLLSLSKKSFEIIFADAIAADQAKLAYFENMLSDEIQKQAIIEFQYMFEERLYSRGDFLFREGGHTTHLYFIKEGEVELSKKVKQGAKK